MLPDPAAAYAVQVQVARTLVDAMGVSIEIVDSCWAWLRYATRAGAVVLPGAVVTTGTWCGLLMAGACDAVEVVFDGIGSAAVQL